MNYVRFTAKIITGEFQLQLPDRTSYSPDIAQRDYHLFTYMKMWLGSQHFKNNEELMKSVSIPVVNMLRSN
jgi:hypothetical protein